VQVPAADEAGECAVPVCRDGAGSVRTHFSKGKRGAVIQTPGKKTRITIRIDDAALNWFHEQAHKQGGGSYQTMMNEALHRFVASQDGDMEKLVRRVLREELEPYVAGATIRRRKSPSKRSSRG
jgi:uncharacterized protein (DUF4415 family)